MGLFVDTNIRRALPVASFAHKFFLFIFCVAVAFYIYIPLARSLVLVLGMDGAGGPGQAVQVKRSRGPKVQGSKGQARDHDRKPGNQGTRTNSRTRQARHHPDLDD